MCGFRDFSGNDFLQCVDAFAGGVEGVHEMHFERGFDRASAVE